MIIWTICINPEDGEYLAFNGDDPRKHVISHASPEAACLNLLRALITQDKSVTLTGIQHIALDKG